MAQREPPNKSKNTELRLNQWMASQGVKELLPQLGKALTLPANYEQVIRELQSPNGSLSKAAAIIAQDPVMAAKVLQAVNSAFYALAQQITDPVEAIFHLGTEPVKALVLVSNAFNQFTSHQLQLFPLEDIWKHSLLVAAFARSIAHAEAMDRHACESAWTAGLLHDIGKLLLAANVTERYYLVWQDVSVGPRLEQRELRLLGTTHAEIGACVLAMWHVPHSLLEAIAWHHTPSDSGDSSPTILTAVHAANVLAHEKSKHAGPQFDDAYVNRLRLQHAPNRWRKMLGLPLET